MSANHWIRQFHRWVSIAFTVAVIINIVALVRKEQVVWGLKAIMKSRQVTYRELARHIGLSEALRRRCGRGPADGSRRVVKGLRDSNTSVNPRASDQTTLHPRIPPPPSNGKGQRLSCGASKKRLTVPEVLPCPGPSVSSSRRWP
jgi:hypothetical protein